ncbi:MAG: AAA family ATPase, partial [Planctomycetes bacterium]|nr:AAA family ATPase [Planctomycetota bacterium]
MSDNETVELLRDSAARLKDELGKVIVGQHEVIEQMLIAMFCGGHSILIGVPGLAKTLLVSTLARLLNLSFRRIQFTPDLLPADIVGPRIFDPSAGTFGVDRGPIFTHILLA